MQDSPEILQLRLEKKALEEKLATVQKELLDLKQSKESLLKETVNKYVQKNVETEEKYKNLLENSKREVEELRRKNELNIINVRDLEILKTENNKYKQDLNSIRKELEKFREERGKPLNSINLYNMSKKEKKNLHVCV